MRKMLLYKNKWYKRLLFGLNFEFQNNRNYQFYLKQTGGEITVPKITEFSKLIPYQTVPVPGKFQ